MAEYGDRKSRKKTPWVGDFELTPTQVFLKEHYDMHYTERHRILRKVVRPT